MNVRDSEEVLGMLRAQGYEIAEEPEAADVILLNTCSVRQHAEERAFGKMGELSVLKQERPDLVLGIIGCMAKLRQAEIFKRLPRVDLVAGPAELYDLPYLLAEIQEQRQQAELVQGAGLGVGGNNGLPRTPNPEPRTRVIAVDRPYRPLEKKPAGDYRRDRVTAFVTIMEGCDKACTYCIVPKTRGQEISRPAEEIIEEINRLVEAGYREVTLLGQNVNSYGKRFPDGSGYKGPLGRLRLLEEDPGALLDLGAWGPWRRVTRQAYASGLPRAIRLTPPSGSLQRCATAPRCARRCTFRSSPARTGSCARCAGATPRRPT
ncbi:MAG: radical SAM protein [Candidatus Omnitrophica bacterium]|nr:radical SAM protein [Candidatus Omnitrophota bacterium]